STPAISTLSLHDALPICPHQPSTAASDSLVSAPTPAQATGSPTSPPNAPRRSESLRPRTQDCSADCPRCSRRSPRSAVCERKLRSEEHTSELQSPYDLVC